MASTYSIGDLERLTGIKAHTIRIWEKRYGLLNPDRTDTNIRLYSDDDLRKILNVNTLLKEGWKISKVSALSQQDMEARVWEAAKESTADEKVYEIYIQALLSASLSFDEDWFESVYSDMTTRYGLRGAMEHIVGPFMARIGLMWTVFKLHPGQEHFASNLVRRKLLTAIDRLPKLHKRGKFLLFLPHWEEHEVGLLYAWYLIREAEYDVIYLGQRVPVQSLVATVRTVRPDTLLTFLVSEYPEESTASFLESIKEAAPASNIMVATRKDISAGNAEVSGVRWLHSSKDLVDIL